MIDPSDVPEIAQANLQMLLKAALPTGVFCFGGQYASPSPLAPRKRQKHYVSDIIVRSSGQWSNASCFEHGDDVISLLAHLQKVNRGVIVGQLAQRLHSVDRLADQIVPQSPDKNPLNQPKRAKKQEEPDGIGPAREIGQSGCVASTDQERCIARHWRVSKHRSGADERPHRYLRMERCAIS
jgi:hypothetical protein